MRIRNFRRRAALVPVGAVAATLALAVAGVSSASAADTIIKFNNWTLSGSVTVKKLNQSITLPKGSTFNGSADLTAGTISGDISVPAFTSSVKVLGIPTTIGLTFTEAGPATGTIIDDPTTSGNLDVNVSAKATLGITSLGILGINLPSSCKTSSAVSFPLVADVPALDLATGLSTTGTTTFPSVSCGGLLGGIEGPLLTTLFSGPGNSYSLTIAPPATTTAG